MQPMPTRRSIARRTAWLVMYAVLGVLAYAAIDVLPPWFRYLQGGDAAGSGALWPLASSMESWLRTRRRWSQRAGGQSSWPAGAARTTVGIAGTTALALSLGSYRNRGTRNRRRRLASVAPSRYPAAGCAFPGTAQGADDNPGRGASTASAPSLPNQFAPRHAETDAQVRPLKFLIIGESSGRGEPYHPWLSVGQIVAWRLEPVFPGRPIQVDIWATGGATLEMMHGRLASLTYRPDALMVYVGHNEFQARFAWMRDVNYYVDSDLKTRTRLYSSVEWVKKLSPLSRLIEESRQRQEVDAIPPRTVTRELVDRPVCTAAEAAAIRADFESRLEAIASYCDSIGSLPIFVIPPSNDAGFDPSRSILVPETTRDQRIAFARAVSRARALEAKDRTQAIRIYRELVQSHPEFAETHYRLARLLEQTGCWVEALRHYTSARESDAMPLRCPQPLRNAYRAVAARHPGLILVDGPEVLAAKSSHRIVGDRFFHDAQHPNMRGYAALAEDLLNQLGVRRAFGWPSSSPVPAIDLESCCRHFQIDAARWEKICTRGYSFFHATAYVRYDPKYRNERSAAYERAAAAIRAGVSPAEAGIPGWPLPPRPATSHVIPLGRTL